MHNKITDIYLINCTIAVILFERPRANERNHASLLRFIFLIFIKTTLLRHEFITNKTGITSDGH